MNDSSKENDYSILIVEDVPVQAKKLQYVLKKFGYKVEWGEHGKHALELLEKGDFQLIISDYQMPEMDGLEFLDEVKKSEKFKKIPFILLTTIEEESILLKSLSLGADEFLNKPFRSEELKIRCRNLILLYEYQKLIEQENQNLNEELVEKNKMLQESLIKLKRAYDQLKEMQSQLVQTSKMASLGVMGAGVAHEINNPLTIISHYNKLLRQAIQNGVYDQDRIDKVNKSINNAVDRIAKIIKHLRAFAGSESYGDDERITIDLRDVLVDLQDFYGGLVAKYGITVKQDIGEKPITVDGIRTVFEQIFLNIIHNAIDAMEEVETKVMTISAVEDDKGIVTVKISDTGTGIPENIRGKIFDPFFTTKAVNKGTGLGMSLVMSYLTEMKGEIKCESSDKGTIFTMYFKSKKE